MQAFVIPASFGAPRIRGNTIVHTVADHFDLTVEQIMKGGRTPCVALARHMCFYLFRRVLGLSYPQIGRRFSRDHATVLYGFRRISGLVEVDPAMAALMASIEAQVRGSQP